VRQTLAHAGRPAHLLASGRRQAERRSVLASLGMLYGCGREPRWAAFALSEPGATLTPYQAAVLGAVRLTRPASQLETSPAL
jgi:hypothetical protein